MHNFTGHSLAEAGRALSLLWSIVLFSAFAPFLGGCESESALLVDLRTDYVAGAEVARVELDLNGGLVERTSVFLGQDLREGIRIGDIQGVDTGPQRIEVRLQSPLGEVIARRRVTVNVTGTAGTTVIVSRSCAGVVCPGAGPPEATECLNAVCVPPDCSPENPDACMSVFCAEDTDCSAATATCASAECRSGACFEVPVPGACPLGSVCTTDGCDVIPLADGGRDGGSDGGPDAGEDGGVCEPPRMPCGADCVDPRTDEANCNSCGNTCSSMQLCYESACVTADACIESVGLPCDDIVGAYIKASDPGILDYFGQSVSISGDTLVVGTLRAEAVYVFRRTLGVWAQEALLRASNMGFGDQFGASVSISGDTLAVGASGEPSVARGINGDGSTDGARNSGAVYLFRRTGAGWREEAFVKSSNSDPGDQFGISVSLRGDALAVGAHGEDGRGEGDQGDNSASQSGAVYVFRRAVGIWIQEAYVKASNADSQDQFGWRLSMSGDTIAVGAFQEDSRVMGDQSDNSSMDSGAVYLFQRTGTTWAQQAYLKASNIGEGDYFGFSVALSPDRLAVGALREDGGATGVGGDGSDNSAMDSGAAYLFRRVGTTWSEEAYVKSSNSESADSFGAMVGLSGEVLVVGARGEDGGSPGVNGDESDGSQDISGAAYVFRPAAGEWAQVAYIKATNPEAQDAFVSGLCIDGETLAVGARQEDSAAVGIGGSQTDNELQDSGAVYTYRVVP